MTSPCQVLLERVLLKGLGVSVEGVGERREWEGRERFLRRVLRGGPFTNLPRSEGDMLRS